MLEQKFEDRNIKPTAMRLFYDEGWVEIRLPEPLPEGAKVARSKANYLISEIKKRSNCFENEKGQKPADSLKNPN